MAHDAAGWDALAALGVRTVPVVARGTDYVFGQSIREVAAFLGLDDAGEGPLPPQTLAERMDRVLAAAARYLRQIPDRRIDDQLPRRARSTLELGHHIAVIADTFFDVAAGAELTTERLALVPPEAMTTGADVAAFAESVRGRLADWRSGAADEEDFTRPVATYYGPQPLHDVLERSTWHAAQHTRQLMMVLDTLGLAPDGPLTPEDLAGLPLPEKVWDE